MRYLCIPEPIILVDLMTGERLPNEKPMPFAAVATGVCGILAQKQTMDALAIIDLRAKLSKPPATWIELTETEYEAIAPEFRKPGQAFFPQTILQMGPFIRAVIDAKIEKPAALAALDNGAAHASA